MSVYVQTLVWLLEIDLIWHKRKQAVKFKLNDGFYLGQELLVRTEGLIIIKWPKNQPEYLTVC